MAFRPRLAYTDLNSSSCSSLRRRVAAREYLHDVRVRNESIDIPRAHNGRESCRSWQTALVFKTHDVKETNMRFMMLMIPKGYESAAPGTVPDARAVEAMMRYNEELQRAGVLLSLDGLHPPSMGARVWFPGGEPVVMDGPFAESKEVLGGYWMIRVKSKQEAIEWAKRCPASPNEVIEIRQVQELEDFPADVQAVASKLPEMQPHY